jgi:hypothetical protein
MWKVSDFFKREPRGDATTEFWKWFIRHQDELYQFEKDQERIFDRLAAQLAKVDRDLCFEFGPQQQKSDTQTREFVISAGGIKRAFPAVVSLANAAPALERWRVTAFRPRRPPENEVEFQGKRVSPEDVHFTLLQNGTSAGLNLFLPGYQENDVAIKTIGYLLLDEALGEYDVETRLGLINMYSPETSTEFARHPFVELPVRFDALILQLEGRSGRPS